MEKREMMERREGREEKEGREKSEFHINSRIHSLKNHFKYLNILLIKIRSLLI
jgi:hypothetical protein